MASALGLGFLHCLILNVFVSALPDAVPVPFPSKADTFVNFGPGFLGGTLFQLFTIGEKINHLLLSLFGTLRFGRNSLRAVGELNFGIVITLLEELDLVFGSLPTIFKLLRVSSAPRKVLLESFLVEEGARRNGLLTYGFMDQFVNPLHENSILLDGYDGHHLYFVGELDFILVRDVVYEHPTRMLGTIGTYRFMGNTTRRIGLYLRPVANLNEVVHSSVMVISGTVGKGLFTLSI